MSAPSRRNLVFLLVVAGATLALDQVTKLWAVRALAQERELRTRPACDPDGPVGMRRVRVPTEPVVLVRDHLSLRYVENCGGAWGLLQGTSERFRYPFFLLVSVAAMAFIVSLYRKVPPGQWMLQWALPFVLGGAVGNFADRLHMRYVVDFILWHVTEGFDWPTFNVADVGISVGVGLLALDMIVGKKPEPATVVPAAAAEPPVAPAEPPATPPAAPAAEETPPPEAAP